uniref:RING-type domain-containing protein n=1 Tax=Graphocephala atropunctata TaxID=36148 RepID=A0A1B6KFP9_9HEMI
MTERDKALQSLFDILTCPVCYTRLCSQPTLCINGHAVCSECTKKGLVQCPICSTEFSKEKHIILTQILEALPFPCSYKGCSVLATDIDHHEKWCGFRVTICERCSWSGPAKKLKGHVETNHKLASNDIDKTFVLLSSFKRCFARIQFGQVFWEITRANIKEKMFSIQLIWVPNGEVKADIFNMKVEFTSKAKSYIANTRIKFDPEDSSENKNCIVFHTDIFEHSNDSDSFSYKMYLTNEVQTAMNASLL